MDVGVLFSTDPIILAKGFVLLQDDKKLQQADNIAPVVRNDLLNKAPADFRTVVNSVTPRITTEELTGLNRKVSIDKQDPKAVAAAWLKSSGQVR